MMRMIVVSILGAAGGLVLAGCSDQGSDQLLPGATAARAYAQDNYNAYNHPYEPNNGKNGVVDPQIKAVDEQQIGPADAVARLHGAQKLPYATLGAMLMDLGSDLSSMQPDSAADLYANGAQALGAAIFASRVPEMVIPSTAALAKQYDIFAAASPEILANLGNSKRCPGVVLVAQNGQFTLDGISCLIGKPAKADHVTLANQLVASAADPKTGQLLAVATLLEAAHTSE
jgi:hypothetical protein